MGQRYVTVAHEVARVAPVPFFLAHSFGRSETGDLGALKAVVGGSGHANAGASDDVAKDLLGTRAWGIEYDVGPLKKLMAKMPEEHFNDKNLKGAINIREITNIELSVKTPVPISASKSYFKAMGTTPADLLAQAAGGKASHIGKIKDSEYANAMVVLKLTDMKMRRYILAVSYDRIVELQVAFNRHVAFAKAALDFRRNYGSGYQQNLTLGERIAYAAATPAGKAAIFVGRLVWDHTGISEVDLSIGTSPIKVTPKRIVACINIAKACSDVYYTNNYLAREARLGIQWEWKKDVSACRICEKKFPSTAMRKEQSKHHCRMCGRVVCHACSGAFLFYETEGKKCRTCTACVSTGAPPKECLADPNKQKGMLTVIMEQQKLESFRNKAKEAKKKAFVNQMKIALLNKQLQMIEKSGAGGALDTMAGISDKRSQIPGMGEMELPGGDLSPEAMKEKIEEMEAEVSLLEDAKCLRNCVTWFILLPYCASQNVLRMRKRSFSRLS